MFSDARVVNGTATVRMPFEPDPDVETERMEAAKFRNLRDMIEERFDAVPLIYRAGRYGTGAEFGAACAFLCSVHAGYITGQNLLLDGGTIPTAF